MVFCFDSSSDESLSCLDSELDACKGTQIQHSIFLVMGLILSSPYRSLYTAVRYISSMKNSSKESEWFFFIDISSNESLSYVGFHCRLRHHYIDSALHALFEDVSCIDLF